MSEARNAEDGTVISYREFASAAAADAEALVLVHGSALSQAIWRGFGYTAGFSAAYRVITLDLRGHGRSAKPLRTEDYRMSLVIGDILAVLDAVGLSAAHYFGYSFGARAGFSLAEAHPSRVLSLVSAGGTHRAPHGSVGEVFFPEYDEALTVGGMKEFLRRWGVASGQPIDSQTALAFEANDALALRAYFRQLEHEPGIPDARLATMTTPTLLLAGSRDRPRAADSRDAARLMPNASFHELPGRTHGSTLRPSAEVIDLVLAFLRSTP